MPSFSEEREALERWPRFPALERLPGSEPRIALSFDDGPDPDATPAVLDELEAHGVAATFFCVGEQVQEHPELARSLAERGNEIALHCFEHLRHPDLPEGAARDDLARGLDVVEAVTGMRPRFFRPPYGAFSEESYAACGELGLEPAYWSAWGLDWESLPAKRIAEIVDQDLEAGAIVLLHDSPRYAPRESAHATAEAIPHLVAAARRRGLGVGPLAQSASEPSSRNR